MNSVLLIGAGFSRNWGGWLVSEVMDSVLGRIAGNPELQRIVTQTGDFEYALDVVQRAAANGGNRQYVELLQQAILQAFADMNAGFARRGGIEFSQDAEFSIRNFLARFDYIFTLNQDLLLELYYDPALHGRPRQRWNGLQYPGMQPSPGFFQGMPAEQKLEALWRPNGQLQVENNLQPIFKLHGSTNWRDANNGTLLIIGGNKEGQIIEKELLSWYHTQFAQALCLADTKLTTIGYSFRDQHVNDAILAGAQRGLCLFLADPRGRNILNPAAPNQIRYQRPLEEVPYIGGSTRLLSEVFAGDAVGITPFEQFF